MRYFLSVILLFCILTPASEAQKRRKLRLPKSAPVETVMQLTKGVTYSHLYSARTRSSIHCVVADLSLPEIQLMVAKGLNNIAGLERVQEIIHRVDSAFSPLRVLAGVNSNFWKAGSNHVIGPAVSNGVFINTTKYKEWSSVAYTADRQVIIDRFQFDLSIDTKMGSLPIASSNRRFDSTSITLYTPFFGPSVPFVDTLGLRQTSQDSVRDETEVDSITVAVLDSIWTYNPEKGTLKIQYRSLGSVRANSVSLCRVTKIDTNGVDVPENGGVLSLGHIPISQYQYFAVGDTFRISSKVFPPVRSPIIQMVTGTPRLVRNGRMSIEWREEGLHKMSFITGKLGRSALGISRNGKKIILVTSERTNRQRRIRGTNLYDLARFLIKKGAYQAMNFDGGSSATMVVKKNTVAPEGGIRVSRKVANALLVVENPNAEQANR